MDKNKTLEPELLIQRLQEAVSEANQQGDPVLKVSALMNLGQAYLDQKEAPDALAQFEAALKIVQRTNDKQLLARLLGLKGLALKMLGNYRLALQAFKRSKGIARELDHPLLLCDSSLQIGVLKSEMEKQVDAQSDLLMALEIATGIHDSARQIRIAGALADNFYSLKDFAKAREYFGLACDKARTLGNHLAECSFLIKIANISLETGELQNAVEQYERTLDIASAIENRSAEINILGGLFRAHALLEDQRLATIYAEKVIQLAAESKQYEAEITTIHALASFLIDHAQYLRALSYIEQGQSLAEQNQSREWQLTLAIASGMALYRDGDYEKAEQAYKQALSLAKSLADKPSEARLLGYLSAVQADREALSASIKSAEHALELAGELKDSGLAGEQQMLLAFDYCDLEQVDRAVEYCSAAITSFSNSGTTVMAARAEALLAELQRG